MGQIRRLMLLTAVIASVIPGLAQERAFPDLQAFLQEARKHVQTDERLLSQYTYREMRREVHLSKLGKVTTGPSEVFEVYPGAWPVPTYRRLVEVDGRPRNQNDLDRDDLEHRRSLEEAQARRARETPSDRAKRLERHERSQAEYERSVDDLLRVYRFTMVSRQLVDGHPSIAIDFVPRTDAAPMTNDGKIMTKVRGRAWISEGDFQIVRVDAETIGDVSYGWGVLGKLYPGTTMSLERRKINDEVWLPAVVRVNAAGRAVVRRFQLDTVIQYSDYHRFGVDTDTAFSLLKKP